MFLAVDVDNINDLDLITIKGMLNRNGIAFDMFDSSYQMLCEEKTADFFDSLSENNKTIKKLDRESYEKLKTIFDNIILTALADQNNNIVDDTKFKDMALASINISLKHLLKR